MCRHLLGLVFVGVAAAAVAPAGDGLMVLRDSDTAVVESTVREARAAVPERIQDLVGPGVKKAYLYTYGDDESDDGGERGYRKQTHDKTDDGYKHFDSYHKKDGDKYGFEAHSQYGDETDVKHEAKSNEAAEKYTREKENTGDEAETQNSYKVVENVHEGKKGVRPVENYDTGFYADSGDAENESEGEYYSEDGDGDGESEHYEGEEGDGDLGHYTADDGDTGSYTAAEYDDDGESEAYTAEEEEEDDY